MHRRGAGRRLEELAAAQGLYLLVTGTWPLVHYRSFEAVTGPKVDRWLVQTVAGLTATIGWTMLRSRGTAPGRAAARRLGVGSALAFGAVDAVYGGSGSIRRVYLADAAVEAGWLAAWALRSAAARR
ncbi:hypothetical protein E7744_00985 [Citricoccus sp. SGAir0253]|nr:hypothetical protein E7744_00985 [Citricoccus sp. SGAir0253]